MGRPPTTPEAASESVDYVLMTVATRLKESRQRVKMTQKLVAELAGMPQSYLYEIESGKTNITLRTLVKLAEVIQIDIRALLPETGPGIEAPNDESLTYAALDKTISILQESEKQDAERNQRHAALLEELRSFMGPRKHLATTAPPVEDLSATKAPATKVGRNGAKRTDRPEK